MKMNSRRIIAFENSQSMISESYKTLRTNIQWSSIDKVVKTILITSPEQNAGKSTTVVNLAVSFAQMGKKVVIVDSDMRKPTQHDYFLKANRIGLSHLLAGHYTLNQCLIDTHVENLVVLPAGAVPPNPAELLSSNRLPQLLGELQEQFDIIVVDSPPTLAVTDARILASKCDGVVFVLKHGKTKREMAQRALADLEHVNANILGVVLNDKQRSRKENSYPYGNC
jgi:capsular exopolysaccharide synthesis family protein